VRTEQAAQVILPETDASPRLSVTFDPRPTIGLELRVATEWAVEREPVETESAGPQMAPSAVGPILLVASSGGHLAQLIALQPWWRDKKRVWVTFDTADARSQLEGEDVVQAHYPTTRSMKNLVRNTMLAFRLLRRDPPAMVVSTGAGVAFPFFVFARIMGIPTIYIEVIDRLDSRTLTGRLCRPFATRFFVQWEQQRELYPQSTVIGTLL